MPVHDQTPPEGCCFAHYNTAQLSTADLMDDIRGYAKNLSQVAALRLFGSIVARTTDDAELTKLRNDLREAQRAGRVLDMAHPTYGLSAAYKLLDKRAATLGFIKYCFGYRKPLTPITQS